MSAWISHTATFLLGVVAGAISMHFGWLLTDRRRERKARKATERAFCEVRDQMPDLIAKMREDALRHGRPTAREFFVLTSRRVLFSNPDCLALYFKDQHDDLSGKLHVLENRGYILDVSDGTTPRYRMTEELVTLLRTVK